MHLFKASRRYKTKLPNSNMQHEPQGIVIRELISEELGCHKQSSQALVVTTTIILRYSNLQSRMQH